jgi:isocitrate dehydrogenase
MPSKIIVPFIPGDGIGPEIMSVSRKAIDAAVRRASNGSTQLVWTELIAGEAARKKTGQWLPQETLSAIRAHGIALKGPLTTLVGSGIRSLNVAIRQALDLYANVRPVRYFVGVPSPVKEPHKMNMVIFRENTEDVYKGIEWKKGSPEADAVLKLVRSLGASVRDDSGVGLKPISEYASKRLVRAALKYAIRRGLPSVTLVHKGNIMKFTEGAFRDWGYELARAEFAEQSVSEADLAAGSDAAGKVVIKDRIADNMFQQILTRPEEYSVLATPNLNGDYLSDACAAQVGGLGLAPGANFGDSTAVFEAVHGTAPKYAGKDVANPSSLMLSGAMMLEHVGLDSAASVLVKAIEGTLAEGILTQDLTRLALEGEPVGTTQFAAEVIRRVG